MSCLITLKLDVTQESTFSHVVENGNFFLTAALFYCVVNNFPNDSIGVFAEVLSENTFVTF